MSRTTVNKFQKALVLTGSKHAPTETARRIFAGDAVVDQYSGIRQEELRVWTAVLSVFSIPTEQKAQLAGVLSKRLPYFDHSVEKLRRILEVFDLKGMAAEINNRCTDVDYQLIYERLDFPEVSASMEAKLSDRWMVAKADGKRQLVTYRYSLVRKAVLPPELHRSFVNAHKAFMEDPENYRISKAPREVLEGRTNRISKTVFHLEYNGWVTISSIDGKPWLTDLELKFDNTDDLRFYAIRKELLDYQEYPMCPGMSSCSDLHHFDHQLIKDQIRSFRNWSTLFEQVLAPHDQITWADIVYHMVMEHGANKILTMISQDQVAKARELIVLDDGRRASVYIPHSYLLELFECDQSDRARSVRYSPGVRRCRYNGQTYFWFRDTEYSTRPADLAEHFAHKEVMFSTLQ